MRYLRGGRALRGFEPLCPGKLNLGVRAETATARTFPDVKTRPMNGTRIGNRSYVRYRTEACQPNGKHSRARSWSNPGPCTRRCRHALSAELVLGSRRASHATSITCAPSSQRPALSQPDEAAVDQYSNHDHDATATGDQRASRRAGTPTAVAPSAALA